MSTKKTSQSSHCAHENGRDNFCYDRQHILLPTVCNRYVKGSIFIFLLVQVCPAPEAADLSGREEPVRPLPVEDRRRHGHEHDLQGPLQFLG